MAKRIEIDGKFYRMRRGVLVEIPGKWLGRFTTPATIRRRQSKMTGKLKRATKYVPSKSGSSGPMYIEYVDKKLEGIHEQT